MYRFLIPLFLLLFTSCSRRTADDRPILTVSIEPLRYVVEAVAGDRFRVQTLMPRGASPETYEPSPRQMVELAESRAVFRTGALGFEQTKLPQMTQTLENAQLIDLSEGIAMIPGGDHAHGGEESADPHLWMSPENLSLMARNACTALCRLDTASAPYYRQRLARFTARMDSLAAELQAGLKPLRRRTFLIYHPALGYFARSFGLKQLAVERDGKAPSAAGFQALVNQCRAEGVKVVFISEEHAGEAARRIAGTLHARTVRINPLDYDVAAQFRLITQSLKDE